MKVRLAQDVHHSNLIATWWRSSYEAHTYYDIPEDVWCFKIFMLVSNAVTARKTLCSTLWRNKLYFKCFHCVQLQHLYTFISKIANQSNTYLNVQSLKYQIHQYIRSLLRHCSHICMKHILHAMYYQTLVYTVRSAQVLVYNRTSNTNKNYWCLKARQKCAALTLSWHSWSLT